jgi:predicted anti-sigma-YlaC factor YlaD
MVGTARIARRLAATGMLILALGGCSIQKLAMRRVADMLSSEESTVFTGDADVDLVGDALPFALKLYESILESVKDSPELYLATGKAFVLYARAYVQMPAEMLPQARFDERQRGEMRAKALYARAQRYVERGLDLRRPGLSKRIMEGDDWQRALDEVRLQDAPWAYWSALAWMGAFSTNTFDFEAMLRLPRVAGMIERVLALDDDFDSGGAHEFLITYYGSLPPDLGGSEQKARSHFERAVAISGGLKAGPYVALALTVSVKTQNAAEFKDLLHKALAIDVDRAPAFRLLNAISQRQAAWLLDHVDDYFLEGGGG